MNNKDKDFLLKKKTTWTKKKEKIKEADDVEEKQEQGDGS